jgi:hypothetical protein
MYNKNVFIRHPNKNHDRDDLFFIFEHGNFPFFIYLHCEVLLINGIDLPNTDRLFYFLRKFPKKKV